MQLHEILEQSVPLLRQGNVDDAMDLIRRGVVQFDFTDYQSVDEFINSPEEIAYHLDSYYKKEMESYPVAAIYLQINDFREQTDCWCYFMHGYRQYGGPEYETWLGNSEMEEEEYPAITLTGMEDLQATYEELAQYRPTPDIPFAQYEVLLEFMRLVKEGVKLVKWVDCPVLAGEWGYDLVAEFRPDNLRGK